MIPRVACEPSSGYVRTGQVPSLQCLQSPRNASQMIANRLSRAITHPGRQWPQDLLPLAVLCAVQLTHGL